MFDLWFIPIGIIILVIYFNIFSLFEEEDSSTGLGYVVGGVFNMFIAGFGMFIIAAAFIFWTLLTQKYVDMDYTEEITEDFVIEENKGVCREDFILTKVSKGYLCKKTIYHKASK